MGESPLRFIEGRGGRPTQHHQREATARPPPLRLMLLAFACEAGDMESLIENEHQRPDWGMVCKLAVITLCPIAHLPHINSADQKDGRAAVNKGGLRRGRQASILTRRSHCAVQSLIRAPSSVLLSLLQSNRGPYCYSIGKSSPWNFMILELHAMPLLSPGEERPNGVLQASRGKSA